LRSLCVCRIILDSESHEAVVDFKNRKFKQGRGRSHSAGLCDQGWMRAKI
jgi:hypothetical protein